MDIVTECFKVSKVVLEHAFWSVGSGHGDVRAVRMLAAKG